MRQITPHLACIQDDASVCAYQINARAFTPFIQIGKKSVPAGTVLAFTGNYNWQGKPIGICFDGDEFFAGIRKYDDIRPILVLSDGEPFIVRNYFNFSADCAVQGGPTLVRKSAAAVDSIQDEVFQADAVRRTAHIAVGISGAGKLIAACFKNASCAEMAKWFIERGCKHAMKLDGGHAAYLECPADKLRLGNQGVVPVALCFKEKGR